MRDIIWFMESALKEARLADWNNEVPVGAVIVLDGKIISTGRNQKERDYNPCGHAEIEAITLAAKNLKSWRLLDCSLIVTLEPCPMCLAACVQARIKKLYFGAYDPKGGAISLGYHFFNDKKLNHQFAVFGGIKSFECGKILSDFFKRKRESYNL